MSYATYAGGNTAKPVDDWLIAENTCADTITAYAGGGQTNATQLAATNNNVTVVASAADSIKLPLAVAGLSVRVRNSAANATQVFGAGTDTINAVATATGLSQAATTSALYFAVTSAPAGKWFRVLSA